MSLADDSLQSVYDLVLEMRTLVVRLDGTPSQPGAIAQTGELVNAVSAVVEKLTLLIDRLIAAAELHEQLKLPCRRSCSGRISPKSFVSRCAKR